MTDYVDVSASALREVSASLRDYMTNVTNAGISAKNTDHILSDCQCEIDRTGAELRKVSDELSMKRSELEDCMGQRMNAEKNKKDAEYRKLNAENERYANKSAADRYANEAAHAQKTIYYNEVKAAAAQTPEQAAPFINAAAAAQKQYNAAVYHKNQCDSMIAAAEKKINAEQIRINSLIKEIEMCDAQISNLSSQIQTLENKENMLKNKLGEMQNAFSTLKADIMNYESEVDRYVSSTNNIADRILNGTEQCIKYIEEYESIRLV